MRMFINKIDAIAKMTIDIADRTKMIIVKADPIIIAVNLITVIGQMTLAIIMIMTNNSDHSYIVSCYLFCCAFHWMRMKKFTFDCKFSQVPIFTD